MAIETARSEARIVHAENVVAQATHAGASVYVEGDYVFLGGHATAKRDPNASARAKAVIRGMYYVRDNQDDFVEPPSVRVGDIRIKPRPGYDSVRLEDINSGYGQIVTPESVEEAAELAN